MRIRILCLAALTLWSVGCNRQNGQSVSAATPADSTAGTGGAVAGAPNPAPAAPSVSDIPAGTALRVRLGDSLDTRRTRSGSHFVAFLDDPIVSGDRVIVPKGTEFRGHVVAARRSGRLKGRATLEVALDSFQLRGSTYEIATSDAGRTSSRHLKRNVAIIGGGSGAGAAIGAVAGGGVGALIGAGAGAAAGTTGAFITGKKDVRLPAETRIVFSLKSAVEVRG
jgi:hypothetical protein